MSQASRVKTSGGLEAREEEETEVSFLPSSLVRDERWYVVRFLAHSELRGETHLNRQGYRVYVPRILRTVRHARKTRTIKSPLFPSYGFIVLDPGRDRWRPVNGTFGVASIVMGKDAPVPLPIGVVESLIEMSDGAGVVTFGSRLKLGQRVRILSGPFANLIGELERFDGSERVRVLLAIMNGSIPVQTKLSSLAPAGV